MIILFDRKFNLQFLRRRYDEERSAKSAERVYFRSRIDLADEPSGGGVGVTEGGEGLIGGIVGAAAGAGGSFH